MRKTKTRVCDRKPTYVHVRKFVRPTKDQVSGNVWMYAECRSSEAGPCLCRWALEGWLQFWEEVSSARGPQACEMIAITFQHSFQDNSQKSLHGSRPSLSWPSLPRLALAALPPFFFLALTSAQEASKIAGFHSP